MLSAPTPSSRFNLAEQLTLICGLLAHQMFLGGVCDRHEASVHSHTINLSLDGDVIVRSARVPDDQVTRIGADLDPLATVLLQPLHAAISETIPLFGPSWDTRLVLEVFVELRAQVVGALAYNETAIIGATGVEVDEALETAESRLLGVLILVGPGFVFGKVGAIREAVVNDIERNKEVLSAVDLLEGTDYAGFTADIPDKVFMAGSVGHQHALFIDHRQLVGMNGRWIVSIIAEAARTSQIPVARPRRSR